MYVIVPKTTGCLFPRLQIKKPYPFKDDLVFRDRKGQLKFHSSFDFLCEDIFKQFDSLDRGFLDYDEFINFLSQAQFGLIEDLTTKDDYRLMVLQFFNSTKEGITMHGFKEFMRKMLENSYKDFNDTLQNLCYNGEFINEKSQMFSSVLCN